MLEHSVAINGVLHKIVNEFIQHWSCDVVEGVGRGGSVGSHYEIVKDVSIRPVNRSITIIDIHYSYRVKGNTTKGGQTSSFPELYT